MAKNSNTLFGTSRSAITKNIISAESVDNIYGAATADNQVKFAYGAIKSAGSSENSNVSGQINFGRGPQGENFGAIFVGHDLVSSKILDISVAAAVDGLSEVTVKFVDMTQDNGIGTLTFKSEAGAVATLKEELKKAVVANSPITGGTHTKITYDSKGLVTSGEDLTAADIPSITHEKISDWDTELAKKQDVLVFNTAYDAVNNKVATMKDISDLSGAMHFLGDVSQKPTSEKVTIKGEEVTAKAGDIVIVPSTSKEYLYNGTAWLELGDEVLYAKKADTISATNANSGVSVTLSGTVSAPVLAVTVSGGEVVENNESVVLGRTVYASIEAAKSAVVGNPDSDTSASKTIEGTRKYVDAVVADKNVEATVAENETLLTATAANNVVTVGSTDALKTAVANANSAVQSFTVGTQTINKTNGAVALDTLKTDLGLGSAAYVDTTAFDPAGAAAAVLGHEGDASTANTVFGAKKYTDAAKAEVIGTGADASTAKTIEGTRKYAESLVSGLTWIMLD